jgi:hypothetical protein
MKHLFRDPISKGFEKLRAELEQVEGVRKSPRELTPAEAESRLSALRSRFEKEPVGDCTGLVGRAGNG